MPNQISRRKFFTKLAAQLFLIKSLSSPRIGDSSTSIQSHPISSRVIRVFDKNAVSDPSGFDNINLNDSCIQKMVDNGVMAFTNTNSIEDAWGKIIPDPLKKVAIKINCQTTGIFTKFKIVDAVTRGLIMMGVPSDNIIIYDLRDNAFESAGFKKNLGSGIKIGTNDELGGFSLFDWFGYPFRIGKPRTRFCKVISGRGKFGCDYLINIPVFKALDGYSGITASMKNHFGSIADPSALHETIHQSIAELNAHPLISDKTRLIIADGIFTQYKWTNGRNQEDIETTNQILIGLDPVAIDSIVWNTIAAIRKKNNLDPLSPSPEYLSIANSQYGLGNTDLRRIDIIDAN